MKICNIEKKNSGTPKDTSSSKNCHTNMPKKAFELSVI